MPEPRFIRLVIPNPPEYVDMVGKRIDKETLQPKVKRYYLTANIFYAGVHERVRMHIVEQVRQFLQPYIARIPVLDNPPYQLEIHYCRYKDIDVDDVGFFWNKVIADMLAPPRLKRKKGDPKNRPLPVDTRPRKLHDDNSKYINRVSYEYFCTEEHVLVLYIIKEDEG